jgi:hypothetical protein
MARLIIWATIVGCAVALFLHIRRHRVRSFHAGWIAVLLLAPCWFRVAPGNFLQMDVRSAAAFVILLAIAMESTPGGIRFRFVLADFLVLFCFLAQIVSHFNAGEITPTVPYNQLRAWVLPYVIGRVFVRGWWDIDRALPAICVASTILACLTVIEGVTRIHIWYKLLGNYEMIWFLDDSVRWGLRRPVVSQSHSIYLGLTMALMVPWVLEAFRRSLVGRGPAWWKAALPILLIGIFFSTSRGAQIAAMCVLAADYFFRKPNLRPVLMAIGIVGAIGAVTMRDQIVDMLSSYAGESKDEGLPVVIDGVTYPYSGTHHRELLSIAYREAYESAGMLGYANPEKVPQPADLDNRLLSIDDHYLMWTLLYGHIGVAGFIALMIVVAWYVLAAAWPAVGPFAGLAGALAGAMLGLAIAMRSVWFASDYGQVWLWTAGVAASIHELRLRALYGSHG